MHLNSNYYFYFLQFLNFTDDFLIFRHVELRNYSQTLKDHDINTHVFLSHFSSHEETGYLELGTLTFIF